MSMCGLLVSFSSNFSRFQAAMPWKRVTVVWGGRKCLLLWLAEVLLRFGLILCAFFRRKRAHSTKCPCCYSSDDEPENHASAKKEVCWFAVCFLRNIRSTTGCSKRLVVVFEIGLKDNQNLGNKTFRRWLLWSIPPRRPCDGTRYWGSTVVLQRFYVEISVCDILKSWFRRS